MNLSIRYNKKEKQWEVWLLKEHTHDRIELLGSFDSEDKAYKAIRETEKIMDKTKINLMA